jgi:hypothetical protein
VCSEMPAGAGEKDSAAMESARLTPAAMERVAANFRRLLARAGAPGAKNFPVAATGTPHEKVA